MLGFGQLGSLAIGQLPLDASNQLQVREPWSEPVRHKPILSPGLNQFISFTPTPPSGPSLLGKEGWHLWLSEPVRTRAGLRSWLQQTIAYHPRILPKPNVFITMMAMEATSDIALFGIDVYLVKPNYPVRADVTITEISATRGGNASIEET